MDDIRAMSGLELAQAIRTRAVSAVEVLDHTLGEIDRLEADHNAFVQVFRRRSRLHAARVDRQIAKGQARGAFAGVPYAIKDLDPVRFARFSAGTRQLRYGVSLVDAPQVTLQRAAGVVLVGKTTTSEMGLLPTVEVDIHAPTRNPWDRRFLSGGSSGGAGSAVAAGMLSLAQGSDGGGSIRIPAALCHLFGFKASRGLMPDFFGRVESFGLPVMGALTHTVDDSAAMLDVLCGRPQAAQPGSLLDASRRPPPEGLRVKLLLDSPVCAVEPDIRDGVQRVAKLLEDMGHHVEIAPSPPSTFDEFLPIYQRLAAGLPVLHDAWVQPVTRWLRAGGAPIAPAEAQERVRYFERLMLSWLGDADLALTPTTPCFAPRVGQYAGLSPEEHFRQAGVLGAFTAVLNCSGQPAASVPVGLGGPDRLPFGAQVAARPGQDVLVLQVCRQLEEAMAWRARRAPCATA